MPLPLLPIAVIGLGSLAWWRHKRKKGMTIERQVIYESALKLERDPAKLRLLAKHFADEGLKDQADMLNKRAALKDLPPSVREARKKAFKAAMSSTNSAQILKLADAYEAQGATGAAHKLRTYAKALEAAGQPPYGAQKEVVTPPVQPPTPATSVQDSTPAEQAVPVPSTQGPQTKAPTGGPVQAEV